MEILQKGIDIWNQWRQAHPDIQPELHKADLRGMDLEFGNFNEADLSKADLSYSILQNATLKRANLRGAKLISANIRYADFTGADLKGAHSKGADLSGAKLPGSVPAKRKTRYKKEGFLSGKQKVFGVVFLIIVLIAIVFGVNKLGDTSSESACFRNQANLKKAVELYYARTTLDGEGRKLQSLSDLVKAGHLAIIPVCPTGGKYILNVETGVVTCTEHPKIK